MRTYVAVLAAAGLLATGSAQAAAPRITLSASTFTVFYGHAVTLAGRISSHQAGRPVSIYARLYASPKVRRTHIVRTGAGGRYSVKVSPSIATFYTARWSTAHSNGIRIDVAPRLAVSEAGDGRIWVQVSPAYQFSGKQVQLQRRVGGGWQTVAQKPIAAFPSTAAIFSPLGRSGTVRAAFSVNEAGKGYLGSVSHPFIYKAYAVTLLPQSLKVLYGNSVLLAGRVQNGQVGEAVTLVARPYGQSSMHLATVSTGIGGSWRYRVTPRIATSYQAHLGITAASPRLTVGVKPLVTARELPSGRISVQVTAARSFRGRQVKLQQLSSGAWQTVAQQPLGPGSKTVFAVPLASSKVRVAFSVNQAGRGYLGSTSHLLAYHGHALALAVSAYKVLYGHTLTISGRIASGHAGQQVVITAWPYGKSSPHRVATLTTGAKGRFAVTVEPAIQTAYTAVSGLSASRRLTVGVKPALSIRELGNGSVWAHVSAPRSLRGRQLQLQQRLPGGRWHTIQQRPLDSSSTAVFSAPSKAMKLRTALSVNEAGVGLLGSVSHVLAFQST